MERVFGIFVALGLFILMFFLFSVAVGVFYFLHSLFWAKVVFVAAALMFVVVVVIFFDSMFSEKLSKFSEFIIRLII